MEAFDLKAKHAMIFTFIFIPLCVAVRILQYAFVIDADGYFRPASGMHTALIYILYVLMALTAVFALVIMLAGRSRRIDAGVFKNNASGILFLTAGIVTMADFGICAGKMLRTMSLDIAAVLEVFAALYFISLGCIILSGSKTGGAARILGLFAPLYAVSLAAGTFLDSYEKVHISQTKFTLLTICMLALFVMEVALAFAGNKITEKRFAAVCVLYSVIASTSSISSLYALASGKATADMPVQLILRSVLQLIFAVLSLIALAHTGRYTAPEPKVDDAPPSSDMSDIDDFIDNL